MVETSFHSTLPKLYLDFPFGVNVFIRKTDADGVSAAQFDLVQKRSKMAIKTTEHEFTAIMDVHFHKCTHIKTAQT